MASQVAMMGRETLTLGRVKQMGQVMGLGRWHKCALLDTARASTGNPEVA